MAGILESAVRPPAAPMSLAAVEAPMMQLKLGAINVIRDSTYENISFLISLTWKAMSQASATVSSSLSERVSVPDVVEAVTDTTMIVAWLKFCSRTLLFLVLPMLLPSSLAVSR